MTAWRILTRGTALAAAQLEPARAAARARCAHCNQEFAVSFTDKICPDCGARFRAPFREMFWAMLTPKTRLLTCTKCNTRGWCVETYGKAE